MHLTLFTKNQICSLKKATVCIAQPAAGCKYCSKKNRELSEMNRLNDKYARGYKFNL